MMNGRWLRIPLMTLLAAALLPPCAGAAAEALPIQDNSFLIEEAYNQEDGVIQHIFTFENDFETHDWVSTWTEEWPVTSQTHQFGFTLPVAHADSAPDRNGFGDLLINYRFQAVGNGETAVALAPRFSLIVPTGDPDKGLGTGTVGYQLNIPLSATLSDRFVTHWNFGATYTPRARDIVGNRDNIAAYAFGASLIWLARKDFNVMLESQWTTEEAVSGPDTNTRTDIFRISPGVRGALNFDNGLQIVPGIAVPVTIGPNAGEVSIFAYLSFEHPLDLVTGGPKKPEPAGEKQLESAGSPQPAAP